MNSDPRSITRPHRSLLTYYFIASAMTLVGFPLVFIPLFIRYKTLQYRFDDEGVSMSWGILFHTQIFLTYRRVQDIHVTRNILERWMGLAKVPIQTASGTSGATMTVVGIQNPEPLRDFLYARMRGARNDVEQGDGDATSSDEAMALWHEIPDIIKELREGKGGFHRDARLRESLIKKMEKLNSFLADSSADEVAAIIVKHRVKPEPKPPRELTKRELRTTDEMLDILRDPNVCSNARATVIADVGGRELGDDTEKFGEALLRVAKFDRVIMNRVLAVKTLGEIGWEGAAPYLQSLINAGSPDSVDPNAADFDEIRLKRKRALSALVELEGVEKHRAFLESLVNNADEEQDIRNLASGWLSALRE